MSQPTVCRPTTTFRTCQLLLAFLLVPLPLVAQGPRPVGLQRATPVRSAEAIRGIRRVAGDDNDRAARGAAIGFTVAVAIVLLSATADGNNDRSGAKIYLVPAGLLGGYIGYLVGRRY